MKQLFFSFRCFGRQKILSMYIIYVLLHLANFVYVEMYSDITFLKLGIPGKIAVFRDLSCLLSFFSQCIFKGQRLNTTVINFTRASTGLECIIRCAIEDKSCRSINFRNQIEDEKNCEFLQNVSSEERADLLLPDEQYDYYILFRHSMVSIQRILVILHGGQREDINIFTNERSE